MARKHLRYAARLRKLANYLAQVPDSQYDHSDYIESGDVSSCNTVGCAMGHAVASGKFKGLGITYNGPGLSSVKTFTFKPVKGVPIPERSFESYAYAGFRAWAEHYFGPSTYFNIFDIEPYGDIKDNGKVKQAVLHNLRVYADGFENMPATV